MDLTLLTWFNGLALPWLDEVMVTATFLGRPVMLALVGLVLLRTRRREGMAWLLALGLAGLGTMVIQFALLRPRPVGMRLLLPVPSFPSFPSGHAAGAFAVATWVALWRRRWALPALSGAALIALSRVYLGVHYPSDGLGGAILGAGCGALVYGLIYQPPTPGRSRWCWLLWGQVTLVLLAILTATLGLLHFGLLRVPGMDKVLHCLLFGGVGFLLVRWRPRWPAWAILAGLSALTAAEEAAQALSATRSADWVDLAASLAGIWLLGWLAQRSGRPPCPRPPKRGLRQAARNARKPLLEENPGDFT